MDRGLEQTTVLEKQIEELTKRFDDLEKRSSALSQQLDKLTKRVNKQGGSVDALMKGQSRLGAEIGNIREKVVQSLDLSLINEDRLDYIQKRGAYLFENELTYHIRPLEALEGESFSAPPKSIE